MQIRSLNMVCLMTAILGYGLVRAVPALREAAQTSLRKGAGETDFVALADRLNDEAAWLVACRAVPAGGQVAAADIEHAYARAIAFAPASAAPHWFYAIHLMHDIPFNRTERDILYAGRAAGSNETGRLSREQKAAAAKADAALDRAGQLDRDNAAIDYLRAYLALAEHRDVAAMMLVRSGLGKPQWNEYGRAAAIATFATLRQVLPATDAATYAANTATHPRTSILEIKLARVLTGMSILAARRRDDEQAIFLRESVDHMGRLRIDNAYQLRDAMTGILLWLIGSAWDSEQPLPSEARDPGDPANEIYPGAAIAIYLRQHGRADLAREYESFGKQPGPAYLRLRQVEDLKRGQEGRDRNLTTALGHLWIAQLPTLSLLLLFGMAALLVRLSRCSVQSVEWSPISRLVVIAACLAVVFAVGLIWPGQSPIREALGEVAPNMGVSAGDIRPGLSDRPWGYYFVIVGLPAILLSTWTVLLSHQRRSRESDSCRVGQYVGTVLGLLLPLAAALSLSVLALAIPAARRANERAAMHQTVIYEGEVAYYGVVRKYSSARGDDTS